MTKAELIELLKDVSDNAKICIIGGKEVTLIITVSNNTKDAVVYISDDED